MDQTHISILPEARHGAFGGTYPGYEEASVVSQGNFYLAHGSSQFFMHQTMYAYMFTDAYGLNGIWEKCKCDHKFHLKKKRLSYELLKYQSR